MTRSKPASESMEPPLFPLADRLRPTRIEDVCGQDHLTAKGKALALMVQHRRLNSAILWGPPGSGKTTLSRILANSLGYPSLEFSATVAKIAEIRAVMQEAESARQQFHRPLVVFVDEIHHFNKHMQDAFLPFVEKGDIILLGTTTENPAFKLNRALISRLQILELTPLDDSDLEKILDRATITVKQLEVPLPVLSNEARSMLLRYSAGDARRLLNGLEVILGLHSESGEILTAEAMAAILQKSVTGYDREGDDRYQLISAFHKSVRNSDMDASLYWLHRMLSGGEDALFLLRRMIRIAAEDVGMADPQALRVCLDARSAYDFLGSPEGDIFLTLCTVYLASAPKSNSLYLTEKRMRKIIEKYSREPVPLHLINPTHFLASRKGAGRDYRYAHDYSEKTTPMETLPGKVRDSGFYIPGEMGFEKIIRERLAFWEKRKRKMREREAKESES